MKFLSFLTLLTTISFVLSTDAAKFYTDSNGLNSTASNVAAKSAVSYSLAKAPVDPAYQANQAAYRAPSYMNKLPEKFDYEAKQVSTDVETVAVKNADYYDGSSKLHLVQNNNLRGANSYTTSQSNMGGASSYSGYQGNTRPANSYSGYQNELTRLIPK